MRATMAVVALLVVSVAMPTATVVAAPAATTQQGSAYSGTHVSFDTESNAMTDYTVNGRTAMESVSVQSSSETQAGGGADVGVDLSAVTDFAGADVSVSATTDTRATVASDSGAEMQAHDTDRGILVVTSGGGSQYVRANISSSSEAEDSGAQRVVVTHDDGSEGTFIATGDGEVTVNERGNVTAQVAEDDRLVYRQYESERSDSDEEQERMIADGTAAAEVFVEQSSEGGQETAADTARYSEDTTVEITQQSRERVNMTVDRSQREGRVIITSVSEQAFSSTDDLSVTVDGEAAAEASSYSEVRQATQDGDQSQYLVRQSSGAEASSDVVVGINHFSSRDVGVASSDGGGGGDGGGGSGGTSPGFGVAAAVLALAGAALVARTRRA